MSTASCNPPWRTSKTRLWIPALTTRRASRGQPLLTLIPGVFLKFTVWLLKTLDYFGMLPKFLLEVSPFHGSLFFTSMGSLGIPPI